VRCYRSIVRYVAVLIACVTVMSCSDPLNPPMQPIDASGSGSCTVAFTHEEAGTLGHVIDCPDGAAVDAGAE
jgi:hypothetical protein